MFQIDRPNSVPDLYHALATPHFTKVRKEDSIVPFLGWSSKCGRQTPIDRLTAFLAANADLVLWVPINNNIDNDGPTSINSCPGRSLAERLTNGIDALIELMVLRDMVRPLPASPSEAVVRYWGATPEAMSFEWTDSQIRELAKASVNFRAFKEDAVFDIRDFGIGILPDAMPDTILSLNRSNKQGKPYLTGKHGQGASNTFQFSRLTVIASRFVDSDEVGLTIVSQFWTNEDGSHRRTPTYKYLTLCGEIMRLKASQCQDGFRHGTLVRHIGYDDSFGGRQGEDSIYGLSQRMLVNALLPVTTELMSRDGTRGSGVSRVPYWPHLHVAKGAIHQLNRNLHSTLHGSKKNFIHIRAHNRYSFHLGPYDFGGLDGKVDLGTARFTFWVLDEDKDKGNIRTAKDAVKNFADGNNPILFTLDGQNHAEESRFLLTAEKKGAGLWAVGRWMVVQVDCNDLHPRAKYDLFTSTRERTKNTPIKRMILSALVDWMANDESLREWNIRLASGGKRRTSDELQQTWIEKIRDFLNRKVDLATIKRRFRRKKRKGMNPPESKNPPPILPHNPPTFIQWGIRNKLTLDQQFARVRMHPGQTYSFCFETDAPKDYWHPDGRKPKSHIVLISDGLIAFKGGEEMKGGRVRCRFTCSEDLVPGESGLIILRLYNRDSPSLIPISTAELHVEVVEQPKPKKPGKPGGGGPGDDVYEWVDVIEDILRPDPITREDTEWTSLCWGADPSKVGFALKPLGGEYKLFYNAELPDLLDAKRCLEPFGLSDAFVEKFELNLVMHAAMALNNDMPDEEAFVDSESDGGPTADEQRIRLFAYYAAVLQTIVVDTRTELRMERDVEKKSA